MGSGHCNEELVAAQHNVPGGAELNFRGQAGGRWILAGLDSGADQSRNLTAGEIDLPDGVVVDVGYEQTLPVIRQGHALRIPKLAGLGRAILKSGLTGS